MAVCRSEGDTMDVEDGGGFEEGLQPAGEAVEARVIGSPSPDGSSSLPPPEGEIGTTGSPPEQDASRDKKDEELHGKIEAFQEQRDEERRRMYHVVMWLCLRLLGTCAALIAVGHGLRFVLSDPHVPNAFAILGISIGMLGVVIGSCCPYELFDFDTMSSKNPKSVAAFSFFSCITNVVQARYFPHLDVVKVFLCLSVIVRLLIGACRLRVPRWWPAITTHLAGYLCFEFTWAGIFLFYDQNDWLPISETPSYVIGCLCLFHAVTACVGWFWHRWHYAELEHGNSVRFYKLVYYWCIAVGLRWASYGITWMASPRDGSEDAVGGALELARGLCMMLPSLAVMVVGRDRFFQTLGRWFDKDGARLRRDGAFVAELLETVPVHVGQTWWIHREMQDESYPAFDPRRCWQKGFVTEMIGQTDVAVRIRNSPNDGETVRVKLPSAGKGESMEELLLRAQRDLRCVEFENMSPELMYRVDSRNKPELQAAWHALSRPVRPGEKIDYFMSNSWYDNPETKWQKLVEVAEQFQVRYGRYPTFWLDKLCIDQQQITDGLKVLPVNVMACSKLLALCGDTYLSRLWCIWELFTLFAFVNETAALDRIEFVFLGTHEAGMRMLDEMASFHVNTAHCYDPNEEARLLRVIDAVGTARFNARIANMARMTKVRFEHSGKWRKSRMMGVTKSMSWRPVGSGGKKSFVETHSSSSVRSISVAEVEEGLAV